MLYPGPINNLYFLFTFINILKQFNVTCLPLFKPINLTNKIQHLQVQNKFKWFDLVCCGQGIFEILMGCNFVQVLAWQQEQKIKK